MKMSFLYKYAPKTLDEVVISNPKIYSVLDSYIHDNNRTPLLLHGGYGLGKSTIARLLPSIIEGETTSKMDTTSLDFSSQGEIRKFFYSHTKTMYYHHFHDPLYFVVDESHFSSNVSYVLRVITDELQGVIQFIFTTNNINAIDEGLRERFNCLHFTPTTPQDWLPRIKQIVESEGILTLNDSTLLDFITNQLNQSSNHRKLLGELELFISQVRRQSPDIHVRAPKPLVSLVALPTKESTVVKTVPPKK